MDTGSIGEIGEYVFSFHTTDRESGRSVDVEVFGHHDVKYPPLDLTHEQFMREAQKESQVIEDYKIPFETSPLYFTEKSCKNKKKDEYVIYVKINNRYANFRLDSSLEMKTFFIIACMAEIDNKFDVRKPTFCGQNIGHKMDLHSFDFQTFKREGLPLKTGEVVRESAYMEECVQTAVDKKPSSAKPSKSNSTSSRTMLKETCHNYDLHLRPRSKVLTCSIRTDKLPSSIAFNEHRIIVKDEDTTLVDTYLPIYIDLEKPVKYKYSEESSLFRIVFNVKETISPEQIVL